jgi:hypothetical protein
LDFRAGVTAIPDLKAGGEFVQLLHPLFCCPGLRQGLQVNRIDFEQLSSLLGVVVRVRCCLRGLRYSPTKRRTMSLMDSWSLVVVILPPVGSYGRVLPSPGMLAKPPRVKGSLADSGRQPEERLQTDVRALRAIVAVDLQGARPAGDALADAASL